MKGIPKPQGRWRHLSPPQKPTGDPKTHRGAEGAVHISQNHREEGDQLVGLGGGTVSPWGGRGEKPVRADTCIPRYVPYIPEYTMYTSAT